MDYEQKKEVIKLIQDIRFFYLQDVKRHWIFSYRIVEILLVKSLVKQQLNENCVQGSFPSVRALKVAWRLWQLGYYARAPCDTNCA